MILASWTIPCLPANRIVSVCALAAEVAAPQRRRAVALVVARIFLIADPDLLPVEQSDDRGEHGLAGELAALQVAFDPAPQPRERLAELKQAVVLGAVPLLPESG